MIEFKRMSDIHTGNRKGIFSATVFYRDRKTSIAGMQGQTVSHKKKKSSILMMLISLVVYMLCQEVNLAF
jgi:hypothetical protein